MAKRSQLGGGITREVVRSNRVEFVRSALLVASGGLMITNLALIFLWAPTESVMGQLQRILYFHVPLAWVGFLAFSIVFIASILYLWTVNQRWDALGHAAAEIGVLFTTLMLFTGATWAKPVWGVWWTWDPRLTTSLIMWLLYVGYLMLRAYAPTYHQAARYSAVMGIVAFVDVPIVYFAVTWWRNIHPEMVIGPMAESDAMDSSMAVTLLFSMLTFTVLFSYMLWERLILRSAEDVLREARR